MRSEDPDRGVLVEHELHPHRRAARLLKIWGSGFVMVLIRILVYGSDQDLGVLVDDKLQGESGPRRST